MSSILRSNGARSVIETLDIMNVSRNTVNFQKYWTLSFSKNSKSNADFM